MIGKVIAAIGARLVRFGNWLSKMKPVIDLTGDRDIEWSWIMGNLPDGNGEVLDFGCGPNPLCTLTAARRGGRVTAFDLMDVKLTAVWDRISLIRGDILTHDFGGKKYDVIINCSAIEHVGLSDRYGSSCSANADIEAMSILRCLIKPSGRMILTLPVGQDAVHSLWHRVYGQERLPLLLKGWHIEKSEYWAKPQNNTWEKVSIAEAFKVVSSPKYYGLGVFVLTPDKKEDK